MTRTPPGKTRTKMEDGMPARETVEVLSCSMTRTPPGKTRTKLEDGMPARETVEVLSCSMTRTPPGRTRTKMEDRMLCIGKMRTTFILMESRFIDIFFLF